MQVSVALQALGGGALIGISASILLAMNGRIAGISGILGELIRPRPGDHSWRLAFLAGMIVVGLSLPAVAPETVSAPTGRSLAVLAVGGLLVGYGTRLGNGCTSGHGVCGIPRASPRSVVATLVYIGVGVVTATAVRMMGGL